MQWNTAERAVDRNRHKNRIKRSGQARLVYVIDIKRNILTTWRWARGDEYRVHRQSDELNQKIPATNTAYDKRHQLQTQHMTSWIERHRLQTQYLTSWIERHQLQTKHMTKDTSYKHSTWQKTPATNTAYDKRHQLQTQHMTSWIERPQLQTQHMTRSIERPGTNTAYDEMNR